MSTQVVLNIGWNQQFVLPIADAAKVIDILAKAQAVRDHYNREEGDQRSHRAEKAPDLTVKVLTSEVVSEAEFEEIKARREAKEAAERAAKEAADAA